MYIEPLTETEKLYGREKQVQTPTAPTSVLFCEEASERLWCLFGQDTCIS